MRYYVINCTDIPYNRLAKHIERETKALFAEDEDIASPTMWYYGHFPPPMELSNMPDHYVGVMHMI